MKSDVNVSTFNMSNEGVLFIVNQYTGLSPYSHEFVHGSHDPQILSGYVSAMSSFMQEVTGLEQQNWKTVFGPSSTLLIEAGEWSLGVISVNRETTEVRSKLRRIIREFEDTFDILKESDYLEGKAFRDFNQFVRRVFVDDRLTEDSIVTKSVDWIGKCHDFYLPSTAFKIARVLHHIESQQSLVHISKQQNIPLTELKEIISRAYWNHAISIEFAPSANDILSLTDRALSILLRKSNPLNISRETLRIISELNGRTPLSTILTAIHFDNKTRAISDLAKLLTRGYIQRISVESKLVLVNECILKELFHIVLGDYKNEEMRELLSTFIDEGISKFPWLSRIKVSKDLEVRTQLEDGMAPSDLDQVYEALEYLIRRVETSISGVRDARFASNLREKAQKKCNETWFSAFQDSIF